MSRQTGRNILGHPRDSNVSVFRSMRNFNSLGMCTNVEVDYPGSSKNLFWEENQTDWVIKNGIL